MPYFERGKAAVGPEQNHTHNHFQNMEADVLSSQLQMLAAPAMYPSSGLDEADGSDGKSLSNLQPLFLSRASMLS